MNSAGDNADRDRGTGSTSQGAVRGLAIKLAGSHRVSDHPSRRTVLLDHSSSLETALKDAYQRLQYEGETASSYGAEWLLDNFYMVQQALRSIRSDMPRRYYRQLPTLDSTPLTGLPRIYALARSIIAHCDCRLNPAQMMRFLQEYQSVQPLTIGELWALPTMFRFGILETLAQAARNVTEAAVDGGEELLATTPSALPSDPGDGTTIANSIFGLRVLATMDWQAFFESVSLVEQVLRRDPARIYSRMDFETRDRYRRTVEELAKTTGGSEEGIARETVRLARQAQGDSGNSSRAHHVGYYLIDAGRPLLESNLSYRAPWRSRPRRWLLRHPTPAYLGCTALLAVSMVFAVVAYALASGGSTLQIIAAGALMLVPSLTVAVNLANWLVTHWLPPRLVPKLDFQKGIPADCRTMVVIPTLLSSASDLESLFQQLELHFLSNQDDHVRFTLLTDFVDAPQKRMPGDDVLLDQATAGTRDLNRRHGTDDDGPFYFFHRERRWNPGEDCWMGWERKRGKLMEFNRLLRGATGTSFVLQEGRLDLLSGTRYVITLDTDTSLPRDSARRLIGAISHPLNRAEFDERSGRVIAGYTILQPRVEIIPTSANRSLFARVYSGDTDVDLYSRAVSDVYQDLFGEGIYVGKGIYDLDAFERTVAGCVPENALLSHDLFEGILGRVGLVTDITLFEDYPPDYLSFAHRAHRWVRGDWQLLPWLLPVVPTESGRGVPNYLPALGRWQIMDNLRRSLGPPALFALLSAGWLWLPGSPLIWTLASFAVPAADLVTTTVTGLTRRSPRTSVSGLMQSSQYDAVRWLLQLAFLPYTAQLTVDAIGATLVRLMASHRRLLQWTTSAHTIYLFGKERKVGVTWRRMYVGPILAASVTFLIVLTKPGALLVAAPLLLAWVISPQIALWTSAPTVRLQKPLSPDQRQALRRFALRTWHYFEEFVGPEDNWLPPDHYQEAPRGLVAHRTSPTNLGLLLLSTLAAYDLGFIGLTNLGWRLGYAFGSMGKLQRYRGHLFNWYDTRSLRPLPPRYVSTVDSGNLAACLLALRQGLLALSHDPVLRWQRWEGLLDALSAVGEIVDRIAGPEAPTAITECREHLGHISRQVLLVQNESERWPTMLGKLEEEHWPESERLLRLAMESVSGSRDAVVWRELGTWVERVRYHLFDARRETDLLLAWLAAVSEPPSLISSPEADPATVDAWRALVLALPTNPRLDEIPKVCDEARTRLAQLQENLRDDDRLADELAKAHSWCSRLRNGLDSSREAASALLRNYEKLGVQAEAYFQAMEFGFLYDDQRQLFHIGHNATTGRLDANYYDLLASEARMTSLVGIAKGDVPQSHWVHLGRPFTLADGERVLLSWGGSMFEYLMPTLLMRGYEGTFIEQSARAAVRRQMAYGREKGVPWGISESGYYAFDANMGYQYGPLGVPGLGLRRNLEADLVIAPYASLLALPFQPEPVMKNLAQFIKLGMLGLYGFCEAIDYTPSRVPPGRSSAIVRSYYAHHHGMSLLAMTNYLQHEGMLRRFHADPRIQSVELLLQEKTPRQAPVEYIRAEAARRLRPVERGIASSPWTVPVGGPSPQVHLLSNRRYTVLVSSTGGGYSHWQDIDLTRWCADATMDDWGTWLYVKDRESGALWSAAHQPIGSPAEDEEVVYYAHRAEFRRRHHDVASRLDIIVAPDDDLEIRRVILTNHSAHRRHLTLTSYGEVVLAPQAHDRSHPAFNKLFIQSEYFPGLHALVFHRRIREADEAPVYLGHAVCTKHGGRSTDAHESDRGQFLGRGRTPLDPQALSDGSSGLPGTTGATLDPMFALGEDIELGPYATREVAYLTLAARSREEVLALIERYQDWSRIELAFDQALSRADLELRHLDLTPADLPRFDQLLSALLYPHAALRADASVLAANTKGQPGLWPYSVSGDVPILLVRIGTEGGLALVQELLRAQAYWRSRQMDIDLVILNQQDMGYDQPLHGQLRSLISRLGHEAWLNQRGGVFVLFAEQMDQKDLILFETAARVILDGEKGSLAQQLGQVPTEPARLPPLYPTLPKPEDVEPTPPLTRPTNLLFDNGLGGFAADGQEYVIYLEPGQKTPAPWINVIANPNFGFLVSESGSGFTWAENSGENRLTTWRNDPVSDAPSEALYLRDEETGIVWSPTPLPAGAPAPYLIHHGAGYSVFEHHSHGLRQHLRLFVAPEAPVKLVHLRLENVWKRHRRVTATFYAEWVLGTHRDKTQQHIVPEFEAQSEALLARNPFDERFGRRVAFLAASQPLHGLTADRTEFLGCQGNLSNPTALEMVGLASAVDTGLDPCAAIQLHVDLAPGEAKEVFFLLGQGADRREALQLVKRFQDPAQVEAAWAATGEYWDGLLGTVTVESPDPAMNLLLNRWLLYQTLACRLWARSALYQSSGAFGFRDQLQDVMALVYAAPQLVRAHILLAAGHQFEEGDVLHWWHPPSDTGVRTRISDDLLWLPLVTAHYVTSTGDASIMNERVPFLKGQPLEPEEQERYGGYETAAESHTLYEHCRRALQRGTTSGAHGLPLIGTGDWNDGLNRVGIQGRGESVWLGWFLYATLKRFSPLCTLMDDEGQAAKYREQAEDLRQALEANAWDGEWYLRAYYDDGTPLGTAQDAEYQISSIAQAWAVLSGAADPARAAQAMESVAERLVDNEAELMLLFSPPFDKTPRDPGYIKGYPPGVRENGGQYTHGVLWTVWAFAQLGQGDRAERLFRLLNPIYHGADAEHVRRYRVEPYAVPADVSGVAPHAGRGGWTWYTGSAGWMYRLGLETILGLRREGETLRITPCIPKNWPGYEIRYQYGDTSYRISVRNPRGVNQGVKRVVLDGEVLPGANVPLRRDGGDHQVQVEMD
jgi:cyclic beta-1,2-glucan synthetase